MESGDASMSGRSILEVFDTGASLNYCVELLLAQSGELRRSTAVRLVKAAMQMPDQFGQSMTSVHVADERGFLRVGGGSIEIFEPYHFQPADELQDSVDDGAAVLLTLQEPSYTSPDVGSGQSAHSTVASFVSHSVMFRAAFSRARVREWLKAVSSLDEQAR